MADQQYNGFPYISHFEGFVKEEFKNREYGTKDINGIPTRYDFLDRTPFISMVSGLAKIDSNGNKSRYILTNTEIKRNVNNNIVSDDIYIFNDKKTFRPYSGITDISVTYKNKFGSVRNATINWVCNSKEKLEELSPFFLTMGHSIFLEWGWSEEGSKYSQIRNFDPKKLAYGVAPKYIYDLISSSYGNYDAMVGIITTYDFKINKDFTYNCITEITSQGFIMPSLQNDALGIDVNTKEKPIVAPPTYLLSFKSYLESGKFYSEIEKYYNIIGTENADPDWMVGVDNISRIKQYQETIAYKASQKNIEDVNMYEFSPERYPMYISWGFIEDVIIGNNYNVIANKDKTDKIELSSLNSTYQKIFKKDCLRSTNLYKCIIPIKNKGKLDVNLLTSELDLENAKNIKKLDEEIAEIQKQIQIRSNSSVKNTFESYFKKYDPTYGSIIPNDMIEIFKMDMTDKKGNVCIPGIDMLYKYFDFKFVEGTEKISYSFIDSIYVELTVGADFLKYANKSARITDDNAMKSDIINLFSDLNMVPIQFVRKWYGLSDGSPIYTIIYKIKVSTGLKNNSGNLSVYKNNYKTVLKTIKDIFSHIVNNWSQTSIEYNEQKSANETVTKIGFRDYGGVTYDLKLCRIFANYGIDEFSTSVSGIMQSIKQKVAVPLYFNQNKKIVSTELYSLFMDYINEYKTNIIGNRPFMKKDDADSNTDVTIMDYFFKNKNILNLYVYNSKNAPQYVPGDVNATEKSIIIWLYLGTDSNYGNGNYLYPQYLYKITDGDHHEILKLNDNRINDTFKYEYNSIIKDWVDLYNSLVGVFKENKDSFDKIAKLESEKADIEARTITEADLTTIPAGYEKMDKFEFDGSIRRIMINAEFFRQTMFNAEFLIDGILAVLNDVSSACGEYFNFILTHNDLRGYLSEDAVKYKFRKNISTSWYVADIQGIDNTGKEKNIIDNTYQFSVFAFDKDKKEKNPFLHKFDVTTKISKEAALNTFYAVQTGEQNTIVHGANLENSFYSLYKMSLDDKITYQDLFINGDVGTAGNTSLGNINKIMEQSRQDILKLHKNLLVTEYLYVYLPLRGSGYDFIVMSNRDNTTSFTLPLEGYEGMSMGLYGRFGNGYDRQSLMPLEVSVEMQGVSGVRISDVFSIDYVPSIYRENGVFHVLGIDQTVSKQNWVTKLSGMYRNLIPFKKETSVILESQTEEKP